MVKYFFIGLSLFDIYFISVQSFAPLPLPKGGTVLRDEFVRLHDQEALFPIFVQWKIPKFLLFLLYCRKRSGFLLASAFNESILVKPALVSSTGCLSAKI
jgi:hypothetical protein